MLPLLDFEVGALFERTHDTLLIPLLTIRSTSRNGVEIISVDEPEYYKIAELITEGRMTIYADGIPAKAIRSFGAK